MLPRSLSFPKNVHLKSLLSVRTASSIYFVKSPSFQMKSSKSHILSARNFTNVWGERTLEWINGQLSQHMDDHEGDYSLENIPYLQSKTEYQRKAIVTPCVQQATTSYLIDQLLNQKYCIRGIAVPDSSEKFIEDRFKMKQPKTSQQKEEYEGKEIDVTLIEEGDLKIEQRVIESFKLNENELQSFDVVFDEMPLLKFDENVKNAKAKTTVLGHSLKTGGVLYLQCEGAKDRKERIELIKSIQSYYPDTHFDLIESRRTPWTRQFLFLKVENTV